MGRFGREKVQSLGQGYGALAERHGFHLCRPTDCRSAAASALAMPSKSERSCARSGRLQRRVRRNARAASFFWNISLTSLLRCELSGSTMTGTSVIRERLQELARSCINDDVQRMTSLADGAWWSRRDIFHAIEPNNPGST